MSYIDALFDRQKDRIYIVERNNGVREYTEYPANYTFYHDDPKGKHKTIYGTPVSRFSTHIGKEFHKEVKINSGSGKKIWESDINPVFRCLSDNYLGKNAPKLHTAFFDIEVDFDADRGFSKPEDPFNPTLSSTTGAPLDISQLQSPNEAIHIRKTACVFAIAMGVLIMMID